MRRVVFICLVFFFGFVNALYSAKDIESAKTKVILLISEQNIESPQRAWWASEIDLSATEAKVATRLIEHGLEVLQPSSLNTMIKKNPAFRMLSLSESQSIKLGNLAKADYIVLGKAVASTGGNVPQSNMRSCFANLSAKLIRVKDNKIITYLDAAGSSAHMDVITGGREALSNAGEDLAAKIIDALNKEGGK